jgi:hypothetical protein
MSDSKAKKLDDFWKQKGRAATALEIQGHMGIIAQKSHVLS